MFGHRLCLLCGSLPAELANFPEVSGVGLEYMPDIDGDDGAARAPYVRSSPLYTMKT